MRDSSLEGRIRAPGPDHAGTLQSSAGLEATLVNLGRHVEAEGLSASAGARGMATLGERHLETIFRPRHACPALVGVGRAAEAKPLLRRPVDDPLGQEGQEEDTGEGDKSHSRSARTARHDLRGASSPA